MDFLGAINMKMPKLATVALAILAAGCAEPEQSGPINPSLEGMWCARGASMIVTRASERGFSAIYNSEWGAGTVNARDRDGRFVFTIGNLRYSFAKTLDARGRLVGTGRNTNTNQDLDAIFKRTKRTTRTKEGMTVPDC
jgi:hypothetical protein